MMLEKIARKFRQLREDAWYSALSWSLRLQGYNFVGFNKAGSFLRIWGPENTHYELEVHWTLRGPVLYETGRYFWRTSWLRSKLKRGVAKPGKLKPKRVTAERLAKMFEMAVQAKQNQPTL